MKKLWVDVRNWDRDIVTAAIESGADAVVVKDEDIDKVKELGVIKTVATRGDIKLGEDVIEVEINSKDDELKAVSYGRSKTVIVKTNDWKIIPLENLIAQVKDVIASVSNYEEAKLALETLEKGTSGILLKTSDISTIKGVSKLVRESSELLQLVCAKIIRTRQLGLGDRVCIDTCTNMVGNQGLLVGSFSNGMFLVRAENLSGPYCDPRPFRVNAGAIHAYVRVPDGKTKYLSDLKSGDDVLVVRQDGTTEVAIVGRVKIERRPMILVEAGYGEQIISLILQNAETIRLMKPDGSPISVTKLSEGDEVIAYVEESGRHFGVKIEESIIER